SMNAGGSQSITITAYDQYGNAAAGYEGSKSLTFSGPGTAPDGTAPTVETTAIGTAVSVNFTAGVSDTGAATLIAYKAESISVDVSDGPIGSSGDPSYDLDLAVNPGAANNLAYSQQPTNTVAGSPITPAVTVEVRDQWNNVHTSDNTTSLGIAINSNPLGDGAFSGTTPRTASSGVATFNDLSIDKTGDGYTLDATSGGLTTATSSGFNIIAPPTIQFTSASSSGDEGTTPVNPELMLSAVSGQDVTVDYTLSGTATGGGTDYTLAAGTATITAGSTTTNIILTIVDDPLDEPIETIILTLSNPTNATLGANTVHTYTIIDNDAPLVLIISGTVTNGGSGLSGVVLNGLPGNPATDANGNYSAEVAAGWSGNVTPVKSGYAFSPSSQNYDNVTSNQAGQDYNYGPDWKPPENTEYNMVINGRVYYNAGVSASEGDWTAATGTEGESDARTASQIDAPSSKGGWLGAFATEGERECRGVTLVDSNGYFTLIVFSNVTSGENIAFKNWFLPDGPEYKSQKTLEFIANMVYDGLELHFNSPGFQYINLVSGWNWISFNTLPQNISLDAVFAAVAGSIEQVKTQTRSAIRVNGSWLGDLSDMSGISDGLMYRIKTSAAAILEVEGSAVVYDTPIPLVAGWNWTAYPPQASEQTETAVSSIMTQATQVKSQTQSVVKIGQDLVGDLEQISPGKGYTIWMDEPGTLIYPEGGSLEARGVESETIPSRYVSLDSALASDSRK
ncbi:hypothetical protein LCGC14_1443850, partial [marine sediment metagenome]